MLDIGNDRINCDTFCEIARNCPGLTDVTCGVNMTNSTVEVLLASSCSKLVKLDMSFSTVGDEGALALADHCPPELEDLNMSVCSYSYLTLTGVHAIVERCKKLKKYFLP